MQSLKTHLGDEKLKVWITMLISLSQNLGHVNMQYLVQPAKLRIWEFAELFGLIVYFVIQICSDMLGVQEFINFTLHYIADLDIPIKRCVLFLSTHGLPSSVHTKGYLFCLLCEPSLCLWSSCFF
jgi:hypothetical protein